VATAVAADAQYSRSINQP